MDAAEKLKAHFEKTEGLTYEKAGAKLGVSRQTIWAWLTQGAVPSEAVKLAIEEWTGGEVPASAWPTVDRRRKPEEPAA